MVKYKYIKYISLVRKVEFLMSKPLILLIEDESISSTFLTEILTLYNYMVITSASGNMAINAITEKHPDLILLDMGLPDMDGLYIIRFVREWSKVPIIVVSARDTGSDKVAALDSGADDYVTKPYDTSELLARIRTALRRSNGKSFDEISGHKTAGVYRYKQLFIDLNKRYVSENGTEIHLTKNEYKIIELLCQNPGKVLTHNFIISNVWGHAMAGDNKILRVNMANIRRKLNEDPSEPKYIFTEPGIGYRIAGQDDT